MDYFDISVVGAGPAGCITAIELQRLGYKVLLIEKNIFPRFHIGFSFSPGILHWLDTLQLTNILSPALLHKHRTTSLLWTENTIIHKQDQGLTVDRGSFDQLLVEHAIALGVSVIQPATDIQVWEQLDKTWLIQVSQENTHLQFGTRFLVEATGRKSLIKTGKNAYLPPLNATYAFLPSSFKHPIVEAAAEGWFWGTPYQDQYLVAYFSHPASVKKYPNPYRSYIAALKSVQTTSLCIPTQVQTFTCQASSYVDKVPITEQYIKVGDAAYTTDPISAQGVTKAIKSAVHASKVIHTLLQRPSSRKDAIAYYQQSIQRDVQQHGQWMHDFYAKQQIFKTPFWQQYNRSPKASIIEELHSKLQPQDLLIMHPNLLLVKKPVLGIHFIEMQTAVSFDPNKESFAFIDNLPIVPILQLVHQQTVHESVNLLYKHYPDIHPTKLLQYLINQHFIVKGNSTSNTQLHDDVKLAFQ